MLNACEDHKIRRGESSVFRRIVGLGAAIFSAVVVSACGGSGAVNSVSEQPVAQASIERNVNVLTKIGVGEIIESRLVDNEAGYIVVRENSDLARLPIGAVTYLPGIKDGAAPTFVKIKSVETAPDGLVKVDVETPRPEEALSAISWNINEANQAALQVVGIVAPGGSKIFSPQAPSVRSDAAHQLGLSLPGVTLVAGNTNGSGPVGLKLDLDVKRPKKSYKDIFTYQKMCSDYLLFKEEKTVDQYCEDAFKISGNINFDRGRVDSQIKAAKDSVDPIKFIFDEKSRHKFLVKDLKIDGSIKFESLASEISLLELLGVDGYKKMYDGLAGFGLGDQNSFAQAKVSGLSSDDKKSRIPLFGIVLSFQTGGISPANNASVTLAAPAGIVVWVHAVSDVILEASAALTVEIEPIAIDVGLQQDADGYWDKVSDFKSVKSGGDPEITVVAGYKGEISAQAGVGVDVDFLLANLRIANLRSEAKARLDGDGEMLGTYSFKDKDFKAEACARFGYGGGLSFSGALALKADYRIRKKEGSFGGELSFVFPEDERDPSDYPFFFYSKKPSQERCWTTQSPVVSFLSAEAIYEDARLAPVVNNVPALVKVGNQSKGTIVRAKLKYKKRDFWSFLPTKEMFDSADGAFNLLAWGKDDQTLRAVSPSGVPVSNGIRMPAGEYFFYVELEDYAGRIGYSMGTGKVVLPAIDSDNNQPNVYESVKIWVRDAIASVVTAVWSFGDAMVDIGSGVVRSVGDVLDIKFLRDVPVVVSVDLQNAAGDTVKRISSIFEVQSIPVEIVAVESDDASPPVLVPNNGVTEDRTPVVRGTLGHLLPNGYRVKIYDGDAEEPLGLAEVSGTNWVFAVQPEMALTAGVHSLTAVVERFDATPGARSAAYVLNVNVVGISGIEPKAATRAVATTYLVSGQGLPVSGLSVTAPGNGRNACATLPGGSDTGFSVSCTLYGVGVQSLQINHGGRLIGSAVVQVASNVTDVNWVSGSEVNYGKGIVRFGELVTYRVSGVHLLADTTMGFAVERCGVSNTEIGNPTDTLRTFQCWFNNQAGAVVGQMPGVVKDSPSGQVLLDGWVVPVESAPVSVVDSVSPASAVLGQATTFSIAGKNLPLTPTMTLGGIPCQIQSSPAPTASGFTAVCTPGGAAGSQVVKISDSAGNVIDQSRSVTVAADALPTPVFSVRFDQASLTSLGGVTSTGGVSYISGKDGRPAAKFSGLNAPGHIKISNRESLKFVDGATFDMWVYMDSLTGMDGWGSTVRNGAYAMALVAKSHDRSGGVMLANSFVDGKTSLWHAGIGSWDSCKHIPYSPIALGTWARVTYVFSSTSGTYAYLNKNLVWECAGDRPNFAVMNTQDMYIGKYSDSWYPFSGAIQDLNVYSKALSSAQVSALQ